MLFWACYDPPHTLTDPPHHLRPADVMSRQQYTLRAIPVGGYVSFPNNYEVDDDGVVTELDDPDLLYNR